MTTIATRDIVRKSGVGNCPLSIGLSSCHTAQKECGIPGKIGAREHLGGGQVRRSYFSPFIGASDRVEKRPGKLLPKRPLEFHNSDEYLSVIFAAVRGDGAKTEPILKIVR